MIAKFMAWWRMQNALANAHCRAVCRQREADYREYLIWRGLFK